MAKPEVEDSVFFVWIGRVHATQTYTQVISSKPETNFDGKNNVLLSTQPTVPDMAKEGVLELEDAEDNIHDGECPPTLSITIKCPDQRVLSVVRVSRALTFAKSPQQRRHYLESFRSCLQEQLCQDEHLSKTIVTVCDGDETTNDETIEDDLESLRNPNCPTQNIGQGLAFLYFFDQLFPVLYGMEDRVGRWSHLKLLPAVVIDCSNDVATANDEQFKAFGWLSIAIDPVGKRQRLISSQVFQLEHDTVIVERPPPIWTLKTLRKIGKLSQEEYESEFLAFSKTLRDLIEAKIFGGQIKECHCSIYDGNGINLADHIWSSREKGNIAHRKPTSNAVDPESDESDDGVETDCEEDSPSRDSDDYNSKLETDCAVDTPSRVSNNYIGKLESDSVAVPKSRGSNNSIGKTETDSAAVPKSRGNNNAIGKLETDCEADSTSMGGNYSNGKLESDSEAVLPAYQTRYPSNSCGYGKDFDDVESACDLKNECVNYAILKLVEVTKDEIVTRDVFYLTEDAGGDYGLKISPSLEVNVSMVTDTRDDGVILNVDMIAAALKQENLISDEVKRRLTSSTYSAHRQASLVLQLLLFILNLNIAIYPSLTKAFEGLKQRAKQPKDGPQEGGNFNSSKTSPAEGVKAPDETAATAKNSKDKKAETKLQKTSLKGPEAKLQIISNVLFTMVEGKNYYPYDFEVQLRKFVFESKQDVSKLRNKDGLTLLQAIVTNNRPQFFSPLFRAGCWSDLKSLKADEGPYEGKSAEDICANARFRKVQKEMDTYTTWEKSLNQIHLAARKGDLVEVKKMLKFSQDLHNEPDSMDCTSLYWAVVGGNVDIVKLLVNLKVDHAKVNKRKESILHVACIVGHTHLLTTLVKDLKMDWTVKDAAKKSPLLRVAENGDDKSLAKLMKCGLRKDKLGSVLAIAGHYGRLGFLRKVIEDHGVDPGSKDDAGKSPFMRACEQGKLEVAKYLLTRGVNICETDTRRRNVLHMAADGAGVDTVEFLINEIKSRKGDDVLRSTLCQRDKYIGGELCMLIRGKDKGRDSWHYVEVCRGLMDVFMKRTRSGTIDVAKYGTLLHSGWGVDPDEDSAREIEQRFETRRNANMAEDLDVTPLHIAAFKDKDDVAELLMERGGDVNVRDKFGLTPLHVAAMRGNLAIVKGLLKRGAATDVLDNLVKTPMDVAEDNEHPEVAAFMRSSQYLPVAQNFRERILPNIQRVFEEEYIRQLQESGRDVRTHLINTLRDLTIDINESLLALGSGPVLEESTPNDHSTKD